MFNKNINFKIIINNINKLKKDFSSINLDNALLSDYLDLVNNFDILENESKVDLLFGNGKNYVKNWSPYRKTRGCYQREDNT